MALALAIAIPISAAGALLARRIRWAAVQSIGVPSQAIGVAVAVVVATLLHGGYKAVITQTLASAALNLVLIWALSDWRPSWIFDLGRAGSDIRFGACIAGFKLSNYFPNQIEDLLIDWRWAAELGHLQVVPTAR